MMGSSDEEIRRLNEKYRSDVEKSPDLFTREGPQHRVRVAKPFYLAKYETTVAQFRWFVDKTDYRTDTEKRGGLKVLVDGKWQMRADASWRNPYFEQGDSSPVTCVSWNDAAAFCKALSDACGGGVGLPTEAEWEYACHAGSGGQYGYGDDPEAKQLGRYGWYKASSEQKAHPVGRKKPNAWGLYDLHGNVWEWCSSQYTAYPYSVSDGREDMQSRGLRVLRGGSWCGSALFVRTAYRIRFTPSFRLDYYGFRCSRAP